MPEPGRIEKEQIVKTLEAVLFVIGAVAYWKDDLVLDWAAKLAKAWSWLTGKDNFSLARLFFLAATVIVGTDAVDLWLHRSWVFCFLACFMGLIYAVAADTVKWWRTSELVRGAKDLALHRRLGRYRAGEALFLQLTMAAAFLTPEVSFSDFWRCLSLLPALLGLYLVSIDRPPYCRSMFKEWAKGSLAKLASALAPPAQIVPAPSN